MKLVLGTVQFGLTYGINSMGRPSNNTVSEILSLAHSHHINTLDTSAAYGDSETVLGNTMGDDQFNIVSKYPKCEATVKQVLHKSLNDLKAKNIYGYLLHHFDVYKQNPNVWREFEAVKDAGLVEKIGFSLYSPTELDEILERGDKFDLVQFPYNIFDRQFEPYFAELKKRGVEIHVRSTFLQGLFFMNPDKLPEKLKPLAPDLTRLHQYAKDNNLSIAQVALNYNLQNPMIDGVLIGVDNCAQLMQNISAISDKTINFEATIKEKELLNPGNWN